MRRAIATALVATLAMAALAGCSDDDDATGTTDTTGTADSDTASTTATLTGTLTVLAASSLTEAFTKLGKEFEAAHDGVKVRFSFAGSSALVQQLSEGAPADVIATADVANMRKVVDAGDASDPEGFTRNHLGIIVEPGNPKRIRGLADLARADIVLVLCAPEVPCGTLAAAALTKAGVPAAPSSLEENVKAVVSKVTLGEADAGIVYVTDIKAAGDKAAGVVIDTDDDPALEAVYPIAVTRDAAEPELAHAWIEFVQSPAGQTTLKGFGFLDL